MFLFLARFSKFLSPRAITPLSTPPPLLRSGPPPLYLPPSGLALRILFTGRCWFIRTWPAYFSLPTFIKAIHTSSYEA
jgi:hypothetical protein